MECVVCHRELPPNPSRGRHRTTCSQVCRNKRYRCGKELPALPKHRLAHILWGGPFQRATARLANQVDVIITDPEVTRDASALAFYAELVPFSQAVLRSTGSLLLFSEWHRLGTVLDAFSTASALRLLLVCACLIPGGPRPAKKNVRKGELRIRHHSRPLLWFGMPDHYHLEEVSDTICDTDGKPFADKLAAYTYVMRTFTRPDAHIVDPSMDADHTMSQVAIEAIRRHFTGFDPRGESSRFEELMQTPREQVVSTVAVSNDTAPRQPGTVQVGAVVAALGYLAKMVAEGDVSCFGEAFTDKYPLDDLRQALRDGIRPQTLWDTGLLPSARYMNLAVVGRELADLRMSGVYGRIITGSLRGAD